MASRWVTVCDLEHEDLEGDEYVPATEKETFDADGQTFELDLCESHHIQWKAFKDQQRKWQSVARVQADTTPRRSSQSQSRSAGDRKENGSIRAWARAQGIEIGDRGRIPDELRQRYRDSLGEAARDRWSGNVADADVPDPSPLAVGAGPSNVR